MSNATGKPTAAGPRPVNSAALMIKEAKAQGHTLLSREMAAYINVALRIRPTASEVEEQVERGRARRVGGSPGAGGPALGILGNGPGAARVASWLAQRGRGPRAPLGPLNGAGSPCQRSAWEALKGFDCILLTGGAGTGKTWLMARLVEDLSSRARMVKCAAPTGKAAQVLSNKLQGFPVYTIHRLLGLRPHSDNAAYNSDRPLDCDVLIVDEASMIDEDMMGFICDAIGPQTILVLVGDPNQIPPVGAGAPFRDMLSASDEGWLPNIGRAHLSTILRQSKDSGIPWLAAHILKGELPNRQMEGVHIFDLDAREVVNRSINWYTSDFLTRKGSRGPQDQLIITPVKKADHEISTAVLNEHISDSLISTRMKRGKWGIGNRVMFSMNDYEHGYVNGEVGTIEAITGDSKDLEFEVRSDNGVVYRIGNDVIKNSVELAYAMTIHKAQGSEAPFVLMALNPRAPKMYTRELIYTAVTRAGKRLDIIGPLRTLINGLKRQEQRSTLLRYYLRNPLEAVKVEKANKPADMREAAKTLYGTAASIDLDKIFGDLQP